MKSGQVTTGHPVDVATGEVYQELLDDTRSGLLDLVWPRRYSTLTLARRPGMLGPGWCLPYESFLKPDLDGFTYRDPSGQEDSFDDVDDLVEQGQALANRANGRTLRRVSGAYEVSVKEKDGDNRKWIYGPVDAHTGQCRLEAIISLEGHRLEMRYTGDRLSEVLQVREKRAYRLVFSEAGDRLLRVDLVRDDRVLTTVVTYAYDEQDRLLTATVPGQYTGRYSYDANHRLLSEHTPLGCVFFFEYDDVGRCIHTYGPERYMQRRLVFEPYKTTVSDSLHHETVYEWNENHEVTLQVSPKGNAYATSYDEHGRIIEQTTPLGDTTLCAYNDSGDLIYFKDLDGGVTRVTFDDEKRLTEVIYPDGNRFTPAYDDAGRITSLSGPMDTAQQYTYSIEGNLLTYCNESGHRWHFRYDRYGNRTEITQPDGQTITYRYDRLDRVVAVSQGSGREMEINYGEGDQITEVRWPDETTSRFTYDQAGNISEADKSEYGAYRYQYGGCGRLRMITDALGGVTRIQWSTEPGQVLAVVNPLGQTYRYEYDAEGNIEAETPYHGGTITYDLDPCGQVVGWQDAAEEQVTLELDPAGRILEKLCGDHLSLRYSYDAMGRVIRGENETGVVALTRDPLGRIVRERSGDFEVTRDYDVVGNLTRLRTSLGLDAALVYDPMGRLQQLRTDPDFSMDFAYDALSMEVMRQLDGGGALRQERDAMGRAQTQELKVRGAVGAEMKRTWRYGPTGDLSVEEDSRWGTRRYTKDPALRITASRKAGGTSETFRYDADDNLISRSFDGLTASALLEDGLMKRSGQQTCSYDENGRLIELREPDWQGREEVLQLTWNPQGQLAAVHKGELSWSYDYDAFGRRVCKHGPRGDHRFYWHASNLIHDSAGGRQRDWLYHPQTFVPLSVKDSEIWLTCVTDQIGLVRELADNKGKVHWSADYLLWGALDRQTDSSRNWPLRYQGQWFDEESGLHYNRFRYYQPDTGRFISPDPLGLDGGFNLFAYAVNPLLWFDPLGLVDEWEVARMGSSSHAKDGLDGHELLQSAWLKHNQGTRADNPYKTRSSGFGRDNPAIGIKRSVHIEVGRLQREQGLHQASTLKGQTAQQNIEANAKILKQAMVNTGMSKASATKKVNAMKEEALAFAKANSCS